jgi:O-antigen/teichoic acid export membrane protein
MTAPSSPSGFQSDFRRVLSASGLYAAAALAQQGASFLLLPVYTRFVAPAQYGQLELLNAFSSIVFACLVLGLPSAVTKTYHRDCASDEERAAVLPTALALGLPVLLAGGGLMAAAAGWLARLLLGVGGGPGAAGAAAAGAALGAGAGGALAGGGAAAGLAAGVEMVRLVAVTGVLASLVAIVLASLRAEERALAFGALTVAQFVTAMSLNILFVVRFGLGARGILWGNLLANAVALALALAVSFRRRGAPSPPPAGRAATRLRFSQRLARPLLSFGVLLLPVLLSAWVLDLSDRYVLRLYAGLAAVAVYAVGYKVGMALQLAVVWPFQLAWPAVSFSISHRPGHQETYSRTFTYLTAVMAFGIVGLTLGSRLALPLLVGPAYREAWRVVPWVALAYAFNGIHYCLSPGVHIAGKTRWFPLFALGCGAVNLGLNFLLIPRYGMMGAAWATAAAFACLALATAWLSQRVYPVDYEYGRLLKVALATALVLFLGTRLPPAPGAAHPVAAAAEALLAVAGLPALLAAASFFTPAERLSLRRALRRQPTSALG